MVSHIGSNDPNKELADAGHGRVREEVPGRHHGIHLDQQLLGAGACPSAGAGDLDLLDGIAVPIVSSDAFEGPLLRRAVEQGIPVVAFNIPDGRPEGERIPYLTYVGGDEYLTGKKLGEYALAQPSRGQHSHADPCGLRQPRLCAPGPQGALQGYGRGDEPTFSK